MRPVFKYTKQEWFIQHSDYFCINFTTMYFMCTSKLRGERLEKGEMQCMCVRGHKHSVTESWKELEIFEFPRPKNSRLIQKIICLAKDLRVFEFSIQNCNFWVIFFLCHLPNSSQNAYKRSFLSKNGFQKEI